MDQFARNDGTKIYYVGGMAGEQIVLYKNTNLYCPNCRNRIVVFSMEYAGKYVGYWRCSGCRVSGSTGFVLVKSWMPREACLEAVALEAKKMAEEWVKNVHTVEVKN